MSHGRGKSDCCVVPRKLPNKAAGETPAAAEVVEGRRQAKGNALAARMSRRSSRVYDMGTALEGIRQTARGRRGAKFTGLLHHIYATERLEAAYYALRRDAAPGVDGQTWQSYGQDLQSNLLDLSDRLARGGYRPQPVRRAYIDKLDGSKRPLGVPALEDKIVQRAATEVLNAIFEQDFLGFSYGFRPGRSAHNALDAVAVGVSTRRVNFVLDADISKFLDRGSYCPQVHDAGSNKLGWLSNTLIRKPFLLPWQTSTASSSPRLTRCNTVWRVTPRRLVASCITT